MRYSETVYQEAYQFFLQGCACWKISETCRVPLPTIYLWQRRRGILFCLSEKKNSSGISIKASCAVGFLAAVPALLQPAAPPQPVGIPDTGGDGTAV